MVVGLDDIVLQPLGSLVRVDNEGLGRYPLFVVRVEVEYFQAVFPSSGGGNPEL